MIGPAESVRKGSICPNGAARWPLGHSGQAWKYDCYFLTSILEQFTEGFLRFLGSASGDHAKLY